MALDDIQKAERRALLLEALVPEKFFNLPLSKQGGAGERLREYVKGDYAEDASEFRGAIIVNNKPGLAQSFSRDIVITGASLGFYYLQTFANKFTSMEHLPHAFALEWFEQDGTPSPFSSSERFRLETAISQRIDDGTIFYLFTSVHPEESQWWSRNFIDTLLDNCRLIEVKDAAKRHNERTVLGSRQAQGQESTKASKRVGIR
jgi:hypothetical protein